LVRKSDNVYLKRVWSTLPRLLALFDTREASPTYGIGDRFRWAWKLIDFGNGTFQGAAHGLARLLVHDLLPGTVSRQSILRRIDAIFEGTERLRRNDGSMEEAFPYEASFCVTALVAFDLLSAIQLLQTDLSVEKRAQYLGIVRPMIRFLNETDETHGFISNHLATAAGALYKWVALTGEPGEKRAGAILEKVLKEQSPEGWFREYDGADPGYQSLCIYYIADLHLSRSDLGLIEPLRRSMEFLWYFAHPDKSFGGYYGSRNARFYIPAAGEALSGTISEATALASFMRESIEEETTVTLAVMDEPNLVPMFNAYCWAAALFERSKGESSGKEQKVPAQSEGLWRKQFPEAGLLVDKGREHYTVISSSKGGVVYHYPGDGRKPLIDTGVLARAPGGKLYSSQAHQDDNRVRMEGDRMIVWAPMVRVHDRLPSPLEFLILRLLNITLMRNRHFRGLIKRILVRMLITGKKSLPLVNRREILLGRELSVTDTWEGEAEGFTRIEYSRAFGAIHMASQGYWQSQDDEEYA